MFVPIVAVIARRLCARRGLPTLPLGADQRTPAGIGATGSDDLGYLPLAPLLARTSDFSCHLASKPVQIEADATSTNDAPDDAVSAAPVKEKHPSSAADNGCLRGWLRGLEPPTSRTTIKHPQVLSTAAQGVTSPLQLACTSLDDLARIVAAWPALSESIRRAMVALLIVNR
jgi:hypothetical protein